VLHRYVPPPEAVKVPEGAAQVRVKEAGAIDAVGAVVFWFTVREAEAVQPFVPSVTVTV
jgi:mannose/fructose/N-acetylgalactosamine-specific phosphotransferase system component IID